MGGIKAIWSNTKQIGRITFLFRMPAFIVLCVFIVLHYQDHQIPLGNLVYFSLVIILVLPIVYLVHYYYSRQTKRLFVKHSTFDQLVVGWSIGLMNLSIVPTIFLILAVVSNHIAIRGLRKVYYFLLIPSSAIISFWLVGMTPIFDSSSRMLYLLLLYMVVHFSILSYISHYFLSLYIKSNKQLKQQSLEINKQRGEILQQAEELKSLNDSLGKLNNSLELKVAERTKELSEKNNKLSQYAFLNAHKLRAPLARLIGLLQLLKYPISDQKEKDRILELIEQSAQELDMIITTINNNLEK